MVGREWQSMGCSAQPIPCCLPSENGCECLEDVAQQFARTLLSPESEMDVIAHIRVAFPGARGVDQELVQAFMTHQLAHPINDNATLDTLSSTILQLLPAPSVSDIPFPLWRLLVSSRNLRVVGSAARRAIPQGDCPRAPSSKMASPSGRIKGKKRRASVGSDSSERRVSKPFVRKFIKKESSPTPPPPHEGEQTNGSPRSDLDQHALSDAQLATCFQGLAQFSREHGLFRLNADAVLGHYVHALASNGHGDPHSDRIIESLRHHRASDDKLVDISTRLQAANTAHIARTLAAATLDAQTFCRILGAYTSDLPSHVKEQLPDFLLQHPERLFDGSIVSRGSPVPGTVANPIIHSDRRVERTGVSQPEANIRMGRCEGSSTAYRPNPDSEENVPDTGRQIKDCDRDGDDHDGRDVDRAPPGGANNGRLPAVSSRSVAAAPQRSLQGPGPHVSSRSGGLLTSAAGGQRSLQVPALHASPKSKHPGNALARQPGTHPYVPDLPVTKVEHIYYDCRDKNMHNFLRVMYTVGVPAAPLKNLTRAELIDACAHIWGHQSIMNVIGWSDKVWVVTFGTKNHAQQAEQRSISLRGVRMTADPVFPAPCKYFIWDATSLGDLLEEEEVHFRVTQAFAGISPLPEVLRQAREGENGSSKKSAGRQYVVRFAHPPRLFSFNLALCPLHSEHPVQAWFKPINFAYPCMLCGKQHKVNELCFYTKPAKAFPWYRG